MKCIYIIPTLVALTVVSTTAYAKYCYTLNGVKERDNEVKSLWNCSRSEFLEMWHRFHMSEHNWDEGFGFNNACDTRRPLARTFNALYLLKKLGGSHICNRASKFNMLPWAYCYAGNSIDELDAECWDGDYGDMPYARTIAGPIIDNYTNVYFAFFYDEDPIQRAGTIVHEARHAEGWCQHKSCCRDGDGACDKNFYNGCTGIFSSSGMGANAITVTYLQHVALYAQNTTNWIKEQAIDTANYYIKNRFCEVPEFTLNTNTGKMIDVDDPTREYGTIRLNGF